MVIFDATALLLLVAPQATTPKDSKGRLIRFAKERIDGEVKSLAKAKVKIIIPTPALSEAFVRAGASAANAYLATIRKSGHFNIASFDERAAIEVALMTQAAIKKGSKKGGSDETWAKIKYDRQIVAIAKVNGANIIYTDDKSLSAFAFAQGLRAISIGDLQVPPEAAQTTMDLEAQPTPAAIADPAKGEDDEHPEA